MHLTTPEGRGGVRARSAEGEGRKGAPVGGLFGTQPGSKTHGFVRIAFNVAAPDAKRSWEMPRAVHTERRRLELGARLIVTFLLERLVSGGDRRATCVFSSETQLPASYKALSGFQPY